MSEPQADRWGKTSPHFLFFVQLIGIELESTTRALNEVSFYSSVGNIEPALARKIELANKINFLSKDLRAALTAYAHKVHEPKPRVATIAQAQGTTTQGMLRRYTAETAEAIRAVADGVATRELLAKAFPSLPGPLLEAFLTATPDDYLKARLEFPGTSSAGDWRPAPLEVDMGAIDLKNVEL